MTCSTFKKVFSKRGESMTIQQFILMLWARQKLVFAMTGATMALALAISLIMPKEYTAATSLVIDVKSPDPIAGVVLQGMMAPGYMATQADIINSDRVARRVVKLLGLADDPEALAQWQRASKGKGSFEAYYGDLLQGKLSVRPSRDSNVINIGFAAKDPAFAAAVANSFAQAYIDTALELRVEPARQYGRWFEQRLGELRSNLEKAQAKLSAYQQEKGILQTDEHAIDSETARLNQLTEQLAATQAQKADAAGRTRNGGSELSPDVLQNPFIQSVKAEIARQEAKLAEVGSNLGHNHPQVQQLEAQIAGLRQQLRAEIGKISGSAAVAGKFSSAKADELRLAIEEQKKRLLQLKSQRDELSVLVNDVETARRAYEAVGQRMSQFSLEGQSQQTNILVLSQATEPTVPSRPKPLVNLVIAAFIGALMGIFSALAVELLHRRIRSADDIVHDLGLPLLVELGPAGGSSPGHRNFRDAVRSALAGFSASLAGRRA